MVRQYIILNWGLWKNHRVSWFQSWIDQSAFLDLRKDPVFLFPNKYLNGLSGLTQTLSAFVSTWIRLIVLLWILMNFRIKSFCGILILFIYCWRARRSYWAFRTDLFGLVGSRWICTFLHTAIEVYIECLFVKLVNLQQVITLIFLIVLAFLDFIFIHLFAFWLQFFSWFLFFDIFLHYQVFGKNVFFVQIFGHFLLKLFNPSRHLALIVLLFFFLILIFYFWIYV